jgi:hypothetical protein
MIVILWMRPLVTLAVGGHWRSCSPTNGGLRRAKVVQVAARVAALAALSASDFLAAWHIQAHPIGGRLNRPHARGRRRGHTGVGKDATGVASSASQVVLLTHSPNLDTSTAEQLAMARSRNTRRPRRDGA